MIRGDLEILKDWCHEAPYNLIAQPMQQAFKLGYRLDSKILGNILMHKYHKLLDEYF